MRLLALVMVCSLLASLLACTKSTDENSSAKKQMLVGGKWQLSASTITFNYMGQDSTVDQYALGADCDKDDFVLFAADGSGIVDENMVKCADDEQIEHFTWKLLDGDTRLARTSSISDTADLQITAAEMVLKLTLPNSPNGPTTFTWTYKNIK